MKILSRLAQICLFVCLQAQAASFDCDQARAVPEKLICGDEELSVLDTQLGATYDDLKQDATSAEATKLTADQLQWLRKTRNRCLDTVCLANAYKSRLNELDPLADKKVTCEEMKKFPKRVFSGYIDLGSGSGSPIDVDYDCPGSLSEQGFLQKLLDLAEKIRAEDGPQICTGTIVHAQWRYYHFALAQAGFAPRLTSVSITADMDSDSSTLRYFKQWSEESLSNLNLYKAFISEFNRVLPTLTDYYENKFRLSASDAGNAARNALMLIADRAAGSFPHDDLKPNSDLVKLARDSRATTGDFRHEFTRHVFDAEQYPKQEIYQALLVALINNRSLPIVSSLGDTLSPEDFRDFGKGKEPLLSFAIGSQQNLEYLLSRKAPMNVANSFGKTAIFYAIGANNHKAVETLLKHGADVNHAYLSAKELRPTADECVYPNLRHTGRTPLMHAAQNSDTQMLKLLVAAGAHLEVTDDLGYNALDYAALGKNKDNEGYLKTLGLTFGSPKYSADEDTNVREHKIQETLTVNGYVSKLLIAPGRPDLLIAAVVPWDTQAANDAQGIYLFSIAEPEHLRLTSTFTGINVHDFALSPDGKFVYIMEMGRGLHIVDVENSVKPTLVNRIEGDFMTMHLSPDGKLLYLQERTLKPDFSRGLLVFNVGAGGAKLKCSNPFGADVIWGSVFAYSFASFLDEDLLLIYDRSRKLLLFDVKNPCVPTKLSTINAEDIGVPMIGLAGRIIISGTGGLQKFRVTDSLVRLTGYEASVRAFYANPVTDSSVAIIGNDVAIFRTSSSGKFILTDRFRISADPIASVLQNNTGQVYVGWKGGLGVGTIPNR